MNHCETYVGHGLTAASRDGLGVGTFDLYDEGKRQLKYVLRPRVPFDFEAGLDWHNGCIGQGYDTWGLIRAFFSEGRGNVGKQWCSEHAARFANKSGYYPFGNYDCEKVSPGMFLASPDFDVIWQAA